MIHERDAGDLTPSRSSEAVVHGKISGYLLKAEAS